MHTTDRPSFGGNQLLRAIESRTEENLGVYRLEGVRGPAIIDQAAHPIVYRQMSGDRHNLPVFSKRHLCIAI
jgi:hypothetical protein